MLVKAILEALHAHAGSPIGIALDVIQRRTPERMCELLPFYQRRDYNGFLKTLRGLEAEARMFGTCSN